MVEEFGDAVGQRLFARSRLGVANRLENLGFEDVDARVESIAPVVVRVFDDCGNRLVLEDDAAVGVEVHPVEDAECRDRIVAVVGLEDVFDDRTLDELVAVDDEHRSLNGSIRSQQGVAAAELVVLCDVGQRNVAVGRPEV